jgi:hypothetical protein
LPESVPTYYAKPLVQHAAMMETGLRVLAKEIVVPGKGDLRPGESVSATGPAAAHEVREHKH